MRPPGTRLPPHDCHAFIHVTRPDRCEGNILVSATMSEDKRVCGVFVAGDGSLGLSLPEFVPRDHVERPDLL